MCHIHFLNKSYRYNLYYIEYSYMSMYFRHKCIYVCLLSRTTYFFFIFLHENKDKIIVIKFVL